MVAGREAELAYCGRLVSFSITKKLNTWMICRVYFAKSRGFIRWLEMALPRTAVPKRKACLRMRTSTAALRTGLPFLSLTAIAEIAFAELFDDGFGGFAPSGGGLAAGVAEFG